MISFREFLKQLPLPKAFRRRIRNSMFPGSGAYWEERYRKGGHSGAGSYDQAAIFKANTINRFIEERNITSAIEFGCGDGHILSLISYAEYTGLDVSPTAIRLCKERFRDDPSKHFHHYTSRQLLSFRAELSLSLDVIYHLIEEDIYVQYMTQLFASSSKYVIIFSTDQCGRQSYHIKYRNFSRWIEEHQPLFRLIRKIENPYKRSDMSLDNSSNADFFIYELQD